MELLLNVATAWISVVLAVLLSVIWVLRIIIKKAGIKKNHLIYRLNRGLRKSHKVVGMGFVAFGVLHGLLSSISVMSLNQGTLIAVLGVIMGLTYYYRRRFGKMAFWIKSHRILSLAVLILIPVHISEVGGIIGYEGLASALDQQASEVVMRVVEPDLIGNTYSDGLYTGVATGYRPGLTVEVVLSDGRIMGVEIVDHHEVGERFYLTAFESIPNQIVERQTLAVDVVSGSTYSSIGVVNAVADALNHALVSGQEIAVNELDTSEVEHGGKGRNRRHLEIEDD